MERKTKPASPSRGHVILASCCCDRLLPLVYLVTDCVMLRDVSALTERDHFQRLKPCVLLSSSHKDFVWLQKTWNATRLVCNAFILLVYGQFFATNTCDCTYLCLLHVLYCSEVGRFRVGVG